VEARSDGPGKGSEFRVRLPIVQEQSPAPEQTSPQNRALPSSELRILVVDDNRDAASSLSMLVEIIGNTALMAHDGEEAVKMAAKHRPHVVLLDIGLPKMNGYDAARAIRQEPWGQNMVLIAVTGWGQHEDKRKSAEAGFDHHTVKPVDPKVLMELLGELHHPGKE
jgi:CheY-like chemotaxis protein